MKGKSINSRYTVQRVPGTGYIIPKIDPDTVFKSLAQAKSFLAATEDQSKRHFLPGGAGRKTFQRGEYYDVLYLGRRAR
jgi:hypothetical protein